MNQGDVILVDLGTTVGHEQHGYRPAVVISADHFNRCGLSIVFPISNQTEGPYRVQIPAEYTAEFGTTGCVLLAHMRTIDTHKRKYKWLGQVKPEFVHEILGAFGKACA